MLPEQAKGGYSSETGSRPPHSDVPGLLRQRLRRALLIVPHLSYVRNTFFQTYTNMPRSGAMRWFSVARGLGVTSVESEASTKAEVLTEVRVSLPASRRKREMWPV